MNPILIAGTTIVTAALLAYSVAVLTVQRKKRLSRLVMIFLTIGICLDIIATTCMILGSKNIPFTVHGILGYSALSGMLVDTVLTWREWTKGHKDQVVPKGLLVYTRIAYLWWVIAFFVGGAISILN